MGIVDRRARRVGRSAVALGLVLAAASVDLVGLPSRGAAAPAVAIDPGFGKAQARLLMLDPRSAQLSFGVIFGPTVADHRNLVARAQALSTDYGIIGSALTAEGCDGRPGALTREQLPSPLRADSRQPVDASEVTVSEGPITQSVQANDRPYAKATSRLAEADLPGILTLQGATDTSISGVDADGVPYVQAQVEVAQLSILGGIVDLQGLHWDATSRGGKKPTGFFTIGKASIGGTPIPTQDASATIAAINNVLSMLGIVVTPPVSHLEGTTMFVDAIKVGISPNSTRDQVAASLLGALQPAREQLFGQLIDNVCGSGAYITVIDILLGSVTGSGSFTAHIGGAQAQLEPPIAASPRTGGGTTATTAGAFRPPASGGGVTFPSPTLSPGVTTPTGGPSGIVPASTTVEVSRASDGALAVGLLVLALGAALVEADRRKMRQAGVLAARHAPTEAPPG